MLAGYDLAKFKGIEVVITVGNSSLASSIDVTVALLFGRTAILGM